MYALGNTTGQSSSSTFDARTVSRRGDGIISLGVLEWLAADQRHPERAAGDADLHRGLANSQTTYTSGTVSLSELGAITISSTTGNQFQLSVNAQSVQPETQTFIGGISASDTLYTSGTVRFTGVGGGITVSSNTGQRVDLSVAAQTNQSLGMYAVQNTTGQSSSTTMDARTLSIAGDGAVSVGYSGGSLRISAPTQTVQTQNLHNVTLSGNTAGAMAQISSGTMTLAGGSNITLSQAGNAVTIHGGAGTGSDTDVSDIAQTGHRLAVGDWVRLDGTDYVLAQADTEENAEVVGVVSAVADADNFTLTTGGLVTGLSGLTAGTVYYLDPDTPGAITDTEPTSDRRDLEAGADRPHDHLRLRVQHARRVVPASAITAFLAGMSNIGNTVW